MYIYFYKSPDILWSIKILKIKMDREQNSEESTEVRWKVEGELVDQAPVQKLWVKNDD